MKTLYQTRATAQGGRHGQVSTDEGNLTLQLALPKGLGGAGGPGANPEQLFACGYAACFDSALQYVAQQQKLPLTGSQVAVQVGIGQLAEGGFGLSVQLSAKLEGLARDAAQQLLEAAHRVCPYSNAIRGNVPVTLVLE